MRFKHCFIVILGILAAVAIPRLAATRDDAKISAAAADITTLYSDLGAYYTAQGHWAGENNSSTGTSSVETTDLRLMTNVSTATAAAGVITFSDGGSACFTVTMDNNGTISAATDAAAPTTVCTEVLELPGVKSLTDNAQTFGGRRVQR